MSFRTPMTVLDAVAAARHGKKHSAVFSFSVQGADVMIGRCKGDYVIFGVIGRCSDPKASAKGATMRRHRAALRLTSVYWTGTNFVTWQLTDLAGAWVYG